MPINLKIKIKIPRKMQHTLNIFSPMAITEIGSRIFKSFHKILQAQMALSVNSFEYLGKIKHQQKQKEHFPTHCEVNINSVLKLDKGVKRKKNLSCDYVL